MLFRFPPPPPLPPEIFSRTPGRLIPHWRSVNGLKKLRRLNQPHDGVQVIGDGRETLAKTTQFASRQADARRDVPAILWIDEAGRICRPHDAQFGTDTFTQFHGKRSAPYLELIRAWVRNGEGAMSADAVRAHRIAPSDDSQWARTERALAWHLSQRGRDDAAAVHFDRAGELAPKDWTIRRGTMPIRGENPFGPGFFALAEEGASVYPMDGVTQTREEEPA